MKIDFTIKGAWFQAYKHKILKKRAGREMLEERYYNGKSLLG